MKSKQETLPKASPELEGEPVYYTAIIEPNGVVWIFEDEGPEEDEEIC